MPSHLEYAYLKGDESCLVIISSKLTEKEKVSLLRVLERRKGTIAWKMSDIKGISPSFCTHKILMGESFKPVIQPQRLLNPKVQDVVKDEIVRRNDRGVKRQQRVNTVSNSNRMGRVHRLSFIQIPKAPEDQRDNIIHPYWDFCYRRNRQIANAAGQLSKINAVIFHDNGAENLAADHLSRLENPNMGELAEEEIKVNFPDDHLMILKTKQNDAEPCYSGPTGGHHSASVTGNRLTNNAKTYSE
ncbi:hypothetical protein Tco_0017626 [Tanacetum coccineum]